MKPSDRYIKVIEWSEEDQCYIGRSPGLMWGGVHGDSEAKVYRELCKAIEEWVQIHEEDGTPLPPPTANKHYSGKFVLRVGESVHEELSLRAATQGESLNSFCKSLLERALHS